MQLPANITSAADLKGHLEDLETERALAQAAGLSDNGLYMENLADEVAFARSAYVGTAVTEIAMLRGALGGRLQG